MLRRMETRRLGRTQHSSSVAILGGAVFFNATPESAESTFRDALERGVNHLDIAPGYGLAERALGPHIPAVRDRLFVAGKTGETQREKAWRRLEKTLERLQVDQLDLYQAHGVTSVDNLDSRDEAFEVILAARDRGLTRFVGITGHDLGAPRAHLEAVRRYDLDTVMFPVYPRVWADPNYRADAEALIEECAARNVGVMVIKAVARRPWADRQPDTASWYEPFRKAEDVARGVHFALSTPGVHAFCTPSSPDVLPLALDAAASYQALADAARTDAMREVADDPLIFPLQENIPSSPGERIFGSRPSR